MSCTDNIQPTEYQVSRLPGTAQIDGNWHKPVYSAIKPLIIGRHMGQMPDHYPAVLVKLAWDDNSLFVIFRVEDRYVRAVARKYLDPVCRDSCVEFFFTPGTHLGFSYFNLEVNCGGTMLFWWHPENGKAIPVALRDAVTLTIAHSQPKIVDPEIQEPVTWTLEYQLPFAVIQKYCPAADIPGPTAVWKANFYKCGDSTSHPHWLTWSIVDHPTPRFHLPQYFGTLPFE